MSKYDFKENDKAQDEMIKEVLSLKDTYGLSHADFGTFLLAVGCKFLHMSGASKENICNIINNSGEK